MVLNIEFFLKELSTNNNKMNNVWSDRKLGNYPVNYVIIQDSSTLSCKEKHKHFNMVYTFSLWKLSNTIRLCTYLDRNLQVNV